LYDAGLVDATTMREFDAMDLTPIEEMSPREIKTLRLHEKVSQGVFALYLNTSISTIQQWERGKKTSTWHLSQDAEFNCQKRASRNCMNESIRQFTVDLTQSSTLFMKILIP